MPVHLRRTLEQRFECVPAERERSGDTDRTPQRVAPPHTLAELEDAGFVDPLFERGFGLRGDGNQPPVGIVDTSLAKPVARGIEISQRLGRGEGL